MLKNIEIKHITEFELDDLKNLVNGLYAVQRPSNYFKWQWFNSQFESLLIGAFVGGEMAGVFGIQKKTLCGNINFGYITNLNVAKKFQGNGIFKILGNEALKNNEYLDFHCVFANEAAQNRCKVDFGLSPIGSMHLMVLENDFGVLDGNSDEWKLNQVTRSTIFPETITSASKAMFEYSSSYRHWRFSDHPIYKYMIVEMENSDFSIIKVFKDPVNSLVYGDIVDFECATNSIESLKKLFICSSKQLILMGANKITTWAIPGTELSMAINVIGFKRSDYKSYFCLRVNNDRFNYLNDLSNWHLRESDASNY